MRRFEDFARPIILALREMGGSGTTSEVIDRVIELLKISPDEEAVKLESGGSRVRNQVQWARLYLVRGGLLDSSRRGVWRLTDKGQSVNPEAFDFKGLLRNLQREMGAERRRERSTTRFDENTEPIDSDEGYSSHLLALIQELPPAGFERLCQRLLRESGFQQVTVTGRSGDGGIDGVGVLQINPFVSFNVLFQCKRYQGLVTPSQVRDFRGAMQGRADKGIIMTTGSFTAEAKKEARRDGVPPIELVSGDDLVQLFESLELGLKARTTYDIDDAFFSEFR